MNKYKLQSAINKINDNLRKGKCKNPFAAENKKKNLQRQLRALLQEEFEAR